MTTDIEFVIDVPPDKTAWSVADVQCERNRHRYIGQQYSFAVEVLQLQVQILACRYLDRAMVISKEYDQIAQGVAWTVFGNSKLDATHS